MAQSRNWSGHLGPPWKSCETDCVALMSMAQYPLFRCFCWTHKRVQPEHEVCLLSWWKLALLAVSDDFPSTPAAAAVTQAGLRKRTQSTSMIVTSAPGGIKHVLTLLVVTEHASLLRLGEKTAGAYHHDVRALADALHTTSSRTKAWQQRVTVGSLSNLAGAQLVDGELGIGRLSGAVRRGSASASIKQWRQGYGEAPRRRRNSRALPRTSHQPPSGPLGRCSRNPWKFAEQMFGSWP